MLYKGYIKSKGKAAIEPFKDRTKFRTYDEVKDLPGFAGVLAEDTILIDIDDTEQSEILKHHRKHPDVVLVAKGADIHTIQSNGAFCGFVQAAKQFDKGRFAGAIQAYQGHFVLRCDFAADVSQGIFWAVFIPE